MGRRVLKKQSENFSKLKISVLASLCIVLAFCVYFVKHEIYSKMSSHYSTNNVLTYWTQFIGPPNTLDNLNIVLGILGWQEVYKKENCSLLWFHDYPFENENSVDDIKKLKVNQRVNHFPGSGWITLKALMAKSVKSVHIPKAFYPYEDAVEMAKYFKANPKKKFVQKSIYNRKVKLISIKDIDMNARDMFLQEFIENPLLLEGYKFDVGIWVVLSSIDPLRLYVFDGQINMRICYEKYYPFDAENTNKYVVHDLYRRATYLPAMGRLVNITKLSLKDALSASLLNEGHDPNQVFKQMDAIIVDVFTQQEKHLIEKTKNYPNKNNFFEFFRFDFIVDDTLKVHLMEVNMSPEMTVAARQKVLYNLLNLVGMYVFTKYLYPELELPNVNLSCKYRTKPIEDQLSGDDEIMVDPYVCGSPPCSESCNSPECSLCFPCLSGEDATEIKNAFGEHVNKKEFRRLIPSSPHYNEDAMKKMSPKNKMMTKWFKIKCEKNVQWC